MPTEAKRETVAQLREELAQARTLIVSEYRGLKVKEIAEIRRALRKQDVTYRVVKNRLLRIAAPVCSRSFPGRTSGFLRFFPGLLSPLGARGSSLAHEGGLARNSRVLLPASTIVSWSAGNRWRSQGRLLWKRGRDRGLWVGFPVLLSLGLICAGPATGPCPLLAAK